MLKKEKRKKKEDKTNEIVHDPNFEQTIEQEKIYSKNS
jgi:hypothetical protein